MIVYLIVSLGGLVVLFAVAGKPIRKTTKEEEEAMRRKPFD